MRLRNITKCKVCLCALAGLAHLSPGETTMNFYKQFGNLMRLKRKERGLSTINLADLLEVDPDRVSKIERGLANRSAFNILKICVLLDINPFEIEDIKEYAEFLEDVYGFNH